MMNYSVWYCCMCTTSILECNSPNQCPICGHFRCACCRDEYFSSLSGPQEPIVPREDRETSNTANRATETTIQNSFNSSQDLFPSLKTESPLRAALSPSSSYRAAANLDNSAKQDIQNLSGSPKRPDSVAFGLPPDLEVSKRSGSIAVPSRNVSENDDEPDESVLSDNESIFDRLSVSSMSSVNPPEFADDLFWEFRNNEIIASLIRVASQIDYDPFIKTFGTLLHRYGTELKICANSPLEKGASRLVVAQSNSLARRLHEHFKKRVSPDLDNHRRAEELELRLAHLNLEVENYAIPRLEQVKDFLFGSQPFSKLVERVERKISKLRLPKEPTRTVGGYDSLPEIAEETMSGHSHRGGKSRDLFQPEIDIEEPVRNEDSSYRTAFNASEPSEVSVPFSRLVALVVLVLRLQKRRTLVKVAESTEPSKRLCPQQLTRCAGDLGSRLESLAENESNSHHPSPENQRITKWLLDSPNYSCSSDDENTRLLKSHDGMDGFEWICVSSPIKDLLKIHLRDRASLAVKFTRRTSTHSEKEAGNNCLKTSTPPSRGAIVTRRSVRASNCVLDDAPCLSHLEDFSMPFHIWAMGSSPQQEARTARRASDQNSPKAVLQEISQRF